MDGRTHRGEAGCAMTLRRLLRAARSRGGVIQHKQCFTLIQIQGSKVGSPNFWKIPVLGWESYTADERFRLGRTNKKDPTYRHEKT
jgi:hypothetical protein